MGWKAEKGGSLRVGLRELPHAAERAGEWLLMESAGHPISSVADRQPHLQKDLLCHTQPEASEHSWESTNLRNINHPSSKQQLLHFQISPVYPVTCVALYGQEVSWEADAVSIPPRSVHLGRSPLSQLLCVLADNGSSCHVFQKTVLASWKPLCQEMTQALPSGLGWVMMGWHGAATRPLTSG